MKWIALVVGICLILSALIFVQIGKGVFFTHSRFEEWDAVFLAAYRECCRMAGLSIAVPIGLLGIALLGFVAWKFLRT